MIRASISVPQGRRNASWVCRFFRSLEQRYFDRG